MSAIGTKRTSACALHMSAFGGRADTKNPAEKAGLRFDGQSSVSSADSGCPPGRCRGSRFPVSVVIHLSTIWVGLVVRSNVGALLGDVRLNVVVVRIDGAAHDVG
jgi:hypothetical protein